MKMIGKKSEIIIDIIVILIIFAIIIFFTNILKMNKIIGTAKEGDLVSNKYTKVNVASEYDF